MPTSRFPKKNSPCLVNRDAERTGLYDDRCSTRWAFDHCVPMIRQTVYFEGQVQGVGFRYTTSNIAQRFAVAGYVQNLPDGRVLLVAEGQPEDVHAFVDTVCDRMGHHLSGHQVDESQATGQFSLAGDPDVFAVRY